MVRIYSSNSNNNIRSSNYTDRQSNFTYVFIYIINIKYLMKIYLVLF